MNVSFQMQDMNFTKLPNQVDIQLSRLLLLWDSSPAEMNRNMVPVRVMLMICEATNFICHFHTDHMTSDWDVHLNFFQLEATYIPITSYPYYSSAITFGTLKPNYIEKTPFQFMKVFEINMWFSILMCMAFASLFNYFVFGRKITLFSSFFYVCNSLIGQFHDWRPRSNPQKLFTIFLNCGIMLISVSYCSVLLSILTLPLKGELIENSDDLYVAVLRGNVRLTDFSNGQTGYSLAQSRNEKIRFLGEELEKSWKMPPYANPYEVLQDNSLVMIQNKLTLESYLNDNYFISDDDIFTTWHALFFGWNFCCKSKVNEIIHRFWASGLYVKIIDDRMRNEGFLQYKMQIKLMETIQDVVRALNLSNLAGAFYILIFGYIIGFACLIFERFSVHFSR